MYPFVGHLAHGFDCRTILDLGLSDPAQLAGLSGDFQLAGLGAPETVALARERMPAAALVEWDLEGKPPVNAEGSAVVCAVTEERVPDRARLVEALHRLVGDARVAVISAPASAPLDLDPQSVEFEGLTLSTEGSPERNTSLAVLGRSDDGPAPAAFSAVAFVTAFNEADIVESTIDHLFGEGLGIYLIDNWSTDGTWELAQSFESRLVGLERFPPDGPNPYFELRRLLGRVEELAGTIRADWFMHVDADERRKSAWSGVSLRDGFWRVDRRGFNAVDYTVVTFRPVDDCFRPGADLERHFRHFEFGRNPGDFFRINSWKASVGPVDLAASGGHRVSFDGRRVFPFNFLFKHYPVRSQDHGERKIFGERRARWSAEERADGWHIQYDSIVPGHRFVRDPATLELFDPQRFDCKYLVERLTRVGIPRPERASS